MARELGVLEAMAQFVNWVRGLPVRQPVDLRLLIANTQKEGGTKYLVRFKSRTLKAAIRYWQSLPEEERTHLCPDFHVDARIAIAMRQTEAQMEGLHLLAQQRRIEGTAREMDQFFCSLGPDQYRNLASAEWRIEGPWKAFVFLLKRTITPSKPLHLFTSLSIGGGLFSMLYFLASWTLTPALITGVGVSLLASFIFALRHNSLASKQILAALNRIPGVGYLAGVFGVDAAVHTAIAAVV